MGGYQGEDSHQFNNLINELMRMNYHQTGAGTSTPGQKKTVGKDRANSEKNQSTYSSSSTANNNRYSTTGISP